MDNGLVTLAEAARLAVQAGLEPSLTRQGIHHLARTDPDWPVPREEWIPAGRTFLLPWARLEPYFRRRAAARTSDLVSFREAARRANDEGILPGLVHQTVSTWARTDPDWPVPREAMTRVGQEYRMPWSRVRPYLLNRATRRRPNGASADA